IISFFVAAFLSGDGAAGLLKGGGIGIVLFIAMLVLSKFLIRHMAEARAKNFTDTLEKLFENFNSQDNPTANWSVVWIPVISKYKIEVTSFTTATATPKYIEQVKVFLGISDSLSDRTSHTIHVDEKIEKIKPIQENHKT